MIEAKEFSVTDGGVSPMTMKKATGGDLLYKSLHLNKERSLKEVQDNNFMSQMRQANDQLHQRIAAKVRSNQNWV